MTADSRRRKRPPKQNPPHVKLFRAACTTCDRIYEGNFPMWVRIDAFPCICGARVPAPLVFDGDGDAWQPD